MICVSTGGRPTETPVRLHRHWQQLFKQLSQQLQICCCWCRDEYLQQHLGGKASAALCRHCCFATMRRVNQGGVRRRPASPSSDKDSNTSFASFYQPTKRPHSLLFPHFRLHSSGCGEKSEYTYSQCLSPYLALDFGELIGKKKII